MQVHTEILKNCSACNSKHTAPFGRYCKHNKLEYCEFCRVEHQTPVGSNCEYYRRTASFKTSLPHGLTMAREKPISDKFTDRSDPEYISFLENQLEQKNLPTSSDFSNVIKRLEALEIGISGRQTSVLGTVGQVGRSTVDGGALGGGAAAGGAVGGSVLSGSTAQVSVSTAVQDGSGGAMGGAIGLDLPLAVNPPDPSLLPLTDALAQLTLAVDPAAGKSKGLFLRPEYHVQHVKSSTPIKQLDHTKLSYKDLVYGWFCVLDQLLARGGDVKSYIGHCKFVSDQATSGSFVDAAFVNYDCHIMSKLIDGHASTFIQGDMLGVATHFNAASLVINKPPPAVKKVGKSRFFQKRQPTDQKDRGGSDAAAMPDGFPEDICYSYNYRTCTGKCSKKHICRSCKGDHQAKQCPKRE